MLPLKEVHQKVYGDQLTSPETVIAELEETLKAVEVRKEGMSVLAEHEETMKVAEVRKEGMKLEQEIR